VQEADALQLSKDDIKVLFGNIEAICHFNRWVILTTPWPLLGVQHILHAPWHEPSRALSSDSCIFFFFAAVLIFQISLRSE
jgi:hypothetical protein